MPNDCKIVDSEKSLIMMTFYLNNNNATEVKIHIINKWKAQLNSMSNNSYKKNLKSKFSELIGEISIKT